MNAKLKKSMKIVTLLTVSLIIATVSAETYNELFIHGSSIGIGTAAVFLSNGSNTTAISSAGISTAKTEVTFNNIPDLTPGETRIYEQAVNITNNAGATKNVAIDLVAGSLVGPFSDNFDYIYIRMVNAAGVTQGVQIQILPSGSNVTSTTSVPMADQAIWAVQWELKAKVDAHIGDEIALTLKVTVS